MLDPSFASVNEVLQGFFINDPKVKPGLRGRLPDQSDISCNPDAMKLPSAKTNYDSGAKAEVVLPIGISVWKGS
jgi:hypothetical protein